VISTNDPACDELFDSVGQTIFGVGLQLERVLELTEDPTLRDKLDATIQGLHDIIGRIRDRGELHCEDASHDC
jgi:hypothetical protein